MFSEFLQIISPSYYEYYNTLLNTLSGWKWLFLIGSPLLFYITKSIVYLAIKWFRKKMYQNFLNKVSDSYIKHFFSMSFENNLGWIFACIPTVVFINQYGFSANIEKYSYIIIKFILAFNLIKISMMLTDAMSLSIAENRKNVDGYFDRQLTPLISKTFRVIVLLIGTLVFLQNIGINVTALIAGLGVGGIAIAFAAQNTVANVFGTITILLDMPFRIGNKIRVNGAEGVVEGIGFRSTQIRTATNTLVYIPNSVIANSQIDNLSEINSIYRFRTVVPLSLNSSANHLQKFTDEIKYILKQDSRVLDSSVSVFFSDLSTQSKNVTIQFQYKVTDGQTESSIQEQYLYEIDKFIQQIGLKFQTTHSTVVLNSKTESNLL